MKNTQEISEITDLEYTVKAIGEPKTILLIRGLPASYEKDKRSKKPVKRIKLRIPKIHLFEKLKQDHDLVELLKFDGIEKLIQELGGETLRVPTKLELDRTIAEMVKSHHSKEPLPEQFEPICRLVRKLKPYYANQLAQEFGGKTINVPKKLKRIHIMVEILELDDIKKLEAIFGDGEIVLPEKYMPSNYYEFRDDAITTMLFEGTPKNIVAWLFDVSEKTVGVLINTLPEDVKGSMCKQRYKTIYNDKGDVIGWKPYGSKKTHQ